LLKFITQGNNTHIKPTDYTDRQNKSCPYRFERCEKNTL